MKVDEILEACRRYQEAEQNLQTQRTNMGFMLTLAKETHNVSELSELTKIKRPTIYWLMKRVENNNGHNDYQIRKD